MQNETTATIAEHKKGKTCLFDYILLSKLPCTKGVYRYKKLQNLTNYFERIPLKLDVVFLHWQCIKIPALSATHDNILRMVNV